MAKTDKWVAFRKGHGVRENEEWVDQPFVTFPRTRELAAEVGRTVVSEAVRRGRRAGGRVRRKS